MRNGVTRHPFSRRVLWIASLAALALTAAAVLVSRRAQAGDREVTRELLPDPEESSRKIEVYWEKPSGPGPWPAIVYLHGHQQPLRPGGKDFVGWGVLRDAARQGYVGIAVSQPGYGASDGPPDFCGPRTQRAVAAVVDDFRRRSFVRADRVALVGISRGAIVAAMLATADPGLAAIVLVSGLFDLSNLPPGFPTRNLREEGVVSDVDIRSRSALLQPKAIRAATLILNGADDDRTSPQQARELAKKIEEGGAYARTVFYAGVGHGIPVDLRAKEIVPFLRERLR